VRKGKSIDLRQMSLLVATVVVGLFLSWFFTWEVIKAAEYEALADFNRKSERYINRIKRNLESGHIAAQDTIKYYRSNKTDDGMSGENNFFPIIDNNSFLNNQRIFIALSNDVTEANKSLFRSRMQDLYGEGYNIHKPSSSTLQLQKNTVPTDVSQNEFPLYYVWSKNTANRKYLLGLEAGDAPAINAFLRDTLKVEEESALILPSFYNIGPERKGLVLLADAFSKKSGSKGILLQLLDVNALTYSLTETMDYIEEGLVLEIVAAWGDGAYGHSTVISSSSLEGDRDISFVHDMQYGAADWKFIVRPEVGSIKVNYNTAIIVAVVGFVLTALFFTILFLQGQKADRVAQIVERRTRALKEAHDELEDHYRLLQNLNSDVEEARQLAETANTAKSEFLATMSHELRTPLNAILGFSQLLSEEALGEIKDNRYVEYAKDIHSSGSHLLSLINDILDLAKLEAGKVVIEKNPVSIEVFVDRVLTLLEQQVQEKGLSISSEIAPDLPESLLGDELRLRQILINLCTNAIKFTRKGSVIVRVLSKHFKDGRLGWVLEVEDTGIGIPEEKQANLFDRFTQVDTALSRRHGGVGLGLAICRELVDRMEGRISVRSIPNVGTTVRVHLPLEQVGLDDVDDTLI